MRGTWLLVREGLRLFTYRGRIILLLYGISLVFLAALDAAALFMLARVFNLGVVQGSSQIVVDTTASSLLLILVLFCLRSMLSTVMTYIALRQAAIEETLIGERALKMIINPRTVLSSNSMGDFQNSVDRGPKELVLIIFNFITIPCEALTALAILSALVLYQPMTALIAMIYFVMVAFIQQMVLAKRSSEVGETLVVRTNEVYQQLSDVHGLRGILDLNQSQSAILATSMTRKSLTRARARQTFLYTLPRYFLEVVLAVGLVVVGGSTFLISGAPAALAATSLFVAAGFRLLPIVNRIQALTLAILAFAPTARLALTKFPLTSTPSFLPPHNTLNIMELENVSFSYAPFQNANLSSDYAIKNVSLQLQMGKQYAIVGPSGAGKTTLVDLLLGLNTPQSGIIRASSDIRSAYVPQDTHIASIPLRNNVALQWSQDGILLDQVRQGLLRSGLAEFISQMDNEIPLDSTKLSGGQKQRIGLARALYADANFLVLDEVTSALDVETEREIYKSIDALRGSATVVIVAHRLSTVQRADEVIYLEQGSIVGRGSFTELMNELPAFQRQVELSQIDIGL